MDQRYRFVLLLAAVLGMASAHADENLFGYLKGAETLPKDSWELYEIVTQRDDKGSGDYTAYDAETELEYGLTDRFTVAGSLRLLSIDTSGLIIDGYLPKEEDFALRASGVLRSPANTTS